MAIKEGPPCITSGTEEEPLPTRPMLKDLDPQLIAPLNIS